jgi:DNA (cytosine-5)-methyltransferase 1
MFSGAGGSATGVELARLRGRPMARVIWAANHLPACVELHAANFPTAEHVCEDLVRFDHGEMPAHDILVASPVCRGYSNAGQPARVHSKVSRSAHNASRATLWSVLDALEIHQPAAFVVENVTEIQRWPLFEGWMTCVRLLGYTVTISCLTASRWGVPQSRLRLFAVGMRNGEQVKVIDPDVPEPGIEDVIDWDAGKWRTFDHCRGSAARPQLDEAHKRFRGGRAFTLQVDCRPVCSASEPMHTMTRPLMSQCCLVRDGLYRKPTKREALRMAGFPDSYMIPESLPPSEVKAMAGDAVPPPVMAGVIEHVLAAM